MVVRHHMRHVALAVERQMLAKASEHFSDFLRALVVPTGKFTALALRSQDLIGRVVVASSMKVVLEDEGNQLFFSFRVFRLWSQEPGAQFLVVSRNGLVMAQVDCLRGLNSN